MERRVPHRKAEAQVRSVEWVAWREAGFEVVPAGECSSEVLMRRRVAAE